VSCSNWDLKKNKKKDQTLDYPNRWDFWCFCFCLLFCFVLPVVFLCFLFFICFVSLVICVFFGFCFLFFFFAVCFVFCFCFCFFSVFVCVLLYFFIYIVSKPYSTEVWLRKPVESSHRPLGWDLHSAIFCNSAEPLLFGLNTFNFFAWKK